MSTEAAFLETLEATPADDTTRLVYADWLDEHGRPLEAEYLRLAALLTRIGADCTREQTEVTRILQLAERLPLEWRVSAGSRFMVVFYDCPDPAKKITAIKCIREATGQGLTQAKDAFEQRPSRLLTGVPFEQALECQEIVLRGLPEVRVLIHPVELTKLPYAGVYTLVANRVVWGDENRPAAEAEAEAAFITLLQTALQLTPEAARELAAQDEVTLAKNLDLPAARGFVAELSPLLSANVSEDWSVWVSFRATLHPTE
jgi:uncharacterized protein (TIGR02996 family)